MVMVDACEDGIESSGSTKVKVFSEAKVECESFELSCCCSCEPMNNMRVAAGGILCLTADLRAGEGEVARNIINSAASLFCIFPSLDFGETGGVRCCGSRGGRVVSTPGSVTSLDVRERGRGEVAAECAEVLEDIIKDVRVAAAFMSSFAVGALAFGGGGCFLEDVLTRGDAFSWLECEGEVGRGFLGDENGVSDSARLVRLDALGESKEE
jgi:hypothetical protein